MPISVSQVISFRSSNQDPFGLSDHEYVYLTTTALRVGLDWMPGGDNGYISGEPPGTLPEPEDSDLAPGEMTVRHIEKLSALIRMVLERRQSGDALSAREEHFTAQRLTELAHWLTGARDVRLVDA